MDTQCTKCDGQGKVPTFGEPRTCRHCGGTGTQDKLERLMTQYDEHGYIVLEDGRRVEIDHPDSPLRKAGLV